MHLLIALLAYLVLTVGRTGEPGVGVAGQIAFVSGSVLGHAAIFMVLQAVVYYGAKLAQPKETYASFARTRLSYLTLGLLVLVVSARLKH